MGLSLSYEIWHAALSYQKNKIAPLNKLDDKARMGIGYPQIGDKPIMGIGYPHTMTRLEPSIKSQI